MKASVKIEGMSLSAKIDQYSKQILEKVKAAQIDTAYEVQACVQSRAPIRTGNYVNTIKVGETTYDGDQLKTEIFSDCTVSSYAGKVYSLGKILEYGTRDHWIYPVKADRLVWKDDEGNFHSASEVHHPGSQAFPHWQPALWENEERYKQAIKEAIKNG